MKWMVDTARGVGLKVLSKHPLMEYKMDQDDGKGARSRIDAGSA